MDLEKQLLGAQHTAAQAFIAAARSGVMAKLLAGDNDGARKSLDAVHALYLKHLEGVQITVVSGNTASTAMSVLVASSGTIASGNTATLGLIWWWGTKRGVW